MREDEFNFSKLKKWGITLGVALLALFILYVVAPWTRVITEPGYETVVIDTPFFYGDKGTRETTLKEGAEWVWSTTTRIPVNVKPYVVPVSIDDFSSMDNILLDFEASVTVRVVKPALLIQKFGPKWWDDNLQRPYISMVRDQVKQYDMAKMMSDPVTAGLIDQELTKELTKKVAELNLPIEIIDISLGRAIPNKEVLQRMNETAAEQQRQNTLEQARIAELKRKDQQEAKADADNAYRNKIGLNVAEYVQLQLADKLIEACKAAQQCVLVPGNGGVAHVLPSVATK